MRVENNNVSGQNHDPEQIDLIDLLVQLWRGKMTIIISVIVAIALAIGYLAVAKEKWTSTAIITQPDVGQIAGYNNAMNVIYGQAAPKVSDLQETLIGRFSSAGNDSNLLIVFYVQIMPDDFVMQLHRF